MPFLGIVPNGPNSRLGSLTVSRRAVRGFSRLLYGSSAEISTLCRVKCQVVRHGFWDDAQPHRPFESETETTWNTLPARDLVEVTTVESGVPKTPRHRARRQGKRTSEAK